jgi:hypothetical protein
MVMYAVHVGAVTWTPEWPSGTMPRGLTKHAPFSRACTYLWFRPVCHCVAGRSSCQGAAGMLVVFVKQAQRFQGADCNRSTGQSVQCNQRMQFAVLQLGLPAVCGPVRPTAGRQRPAQSEGPEAST